MVAGLQKDCMVFVTAVAGPRQVNLLQLCPVSTPVLAPNVVVREEGIGGQIGCCSSSRPLCWSTT